MDDGSIYNRKMRRWTGPAWNLAARCENIGDLSCLIYIAFVKNKDTVTIGIQVHYLVNDMI